MYVCTSWGLGLLNSGFVFGVSDSFYCPEFRVWVQPLGLLSRYLTCYVNAYYALKTVCSRLFDLTALRAESKPAETRDAAETKPVEKAPLTLRMHCFGV